MKFAVLKYKNTCKGQKVTKQQISIWIFLFIDEISVVLCKIVYLFMKILKNKDNCIA